MQLLLDQRSTAVNTRMKDGSPPLLLAAGLGRGKVIRLLIARGADITAKNLAGITALRLAAVGGHEATVRLLEKGASAKE